MADALSSADIISASVAPFSVVLASSALILSMIELRSAMSGRPPFAPFHAVIKETHRLGPVRLDQQRKKPLASDHKFRQRSAGLSLSVKLGLLFRRGCLVAPIKEGRDREIHIERGHLCPPLLRANLRRFGDALGRFRYIVVCNGNRLRVPL